MTTVTLSREAYSALLDLAYRVARLNVPKAGQPAEIGAGMLTDLTERAQRAAAGAVLSASLDSEAKRLARTTHLSYAQALANLRALTPNCAGPLTGAELAAAVGKPL